MKIFISLYSESCPFMEVSRFIKIHLINNIPKTRNNRKKIYNLKIPREKWATVKPNEVRETKLKIK